MQDDPRFAKFLRETAARSERAEKQVKALVKRYHEVASQLEDQSIEQKKLGDAVRKAAARIRYIEDIPGKRVPFFMGFQINIPGPTSPSMTIAGSRLSDVKNVSQDGPFVCTSYASAFLMRTYSIGPFQTDDDVGRPNDPPAGSEVITPLSGRFRPVASSADDFEGAYIGARLGPISVAGALTARTYRPGAIDFLFEVSDAGTDRMRTNNVPIPSRYLFSEFDRPLYLPVSDFFAPNSAIQFSATLTRELGFAEVNYALLPNGFMEGSLTPPPDPTAQPNEGRAVVSIGGTLYFTMIGYKILQAQSPAV